MNKQSQLKRKISSSSSNKTRSLAVRKRKESWCNEESEVVLVGSETVSAAKLLRKTLKDCGNFYICIILHDLLLCLNCRKWI